MINLIFVSVSITYTFFYPLYLCIVILAEKRAKVQKELSEIDEMYKKETEIDEEMDDRDDDTNRSVDMDTPEN